MLVAAALLGLIALLATLQYRWLGQVSDAERERMKTNLAGRATAFAQDFDREITRAYLLFQLDPLNGETHVAAHVAQRFESWQASSRFPRLLKDVYVVSRGQGDVALQRLKPSTRLIEPTDWPAMLHPIRTALTPAPVTEVSPEETIVMRTMPSSLWESIPAIVVPAPTVVFNTTRQVRLLGNAAGDMKIAPAAMSYVILVLDRDYMSGEMIPSLAEQHFRGASDGIDYQMAVVSADDGGPIFTTSETFRPTPATEADASAALFQVRLQEFGAMVSEVRRFTSFISTRIETQRRREGSPAAVAFRDAPWSIMLQHGSPADKRAIETGMTMAAGSRVALRSAERWRLVVKHPAGSLETAVSNARRRNLLVSSGILAMLCVSVGFLVVSTRRAQDLARQQMEFVAAVSHELRTPLAVIRSAADNLAEGVVHEDTQVRKYGALVRGEGRRLSEMVEQILELAGIHSGQRGFALAPIPVMPLLREVVSMSSTLIEEAGMVVEYDVPDALPPVLGDQHALRRVFQNLLGNAIKYGADGRWIGLTARSTGREVLVTVADRGIGIEPAEQARIFEPFYRAPGAIAAQIQGAGLGLSLVQRIVEAHGGRITVRSAPGDGSEFVVHLPSASEEGAPRTSPVPDPASTSA